MRSFRLPERPCLVAAALLAALLAPAARAQDEGEAAPFVGESIIPWDLPGDGDGQLEPNEMDVLALAQLLDSVSAPPPPIETVHVGTYDAATGEFIWGADILMVPTLKAIDVPLVDIDGLFESYGIEALHVDLDPAITGLGSSSFAQPSGVQPSGAMASGATAGAAPSAPKPKPGKAGKPGKGSGAGDSATSDRLRGHPGEKGFMRTWCDAAKLVLTVDVVNRPAGKAPLVLTVDGVTVQSLADTVDLIVPPRTEHEFTVGCGKVPPFTETLSVARPPLVGAFTLEALPVAIVYEPPGGGGCSQTWTQTHRVGTQIRSFQSDDDSSHGVVDTPFSRVEDFIAIMSTVGSTASQSQVPYVSQAGTVVAGAATAMSVAWGHSTTTEVVSHQVNESHVLSFQLAESTSVTTTEGLGPGEGDVYYLLIKPTFAWLVTESQASKRLYVTVALLGYEGHATVSAKALRSHVLALPPVDAQDQLLALDPLAAEYVAPSSKIFKAAKLGAQPGSGFAGPAPPRLLQLASPLIVVSGGSNSFSVSRQVETSDLVETQDIRTTTTEEEGGLLSYVRTDVPQTGNRTLRVLGGRSTLSTVSDQVNVSVTLSSPSDQPLYLEAFYDRLFGTFAFRPYEPGTEAMSGTVTDDAGAPKPNHEVTAKLPDGRGMTTRTDDKGHFEIKPPPGTKGPVLVESGHGRTRVDWDGKAVADVQVREARPTLAKAGGKKQKDTKFPDPSTVPVTASETATTATAQRGKPGLDARKSSGPVSLKPDPSMKGRLGRIVISFAGEADVKSCRLDVLNGEPEQAIKSSYGSLAEELMPAMYAVSISGLRVPGVEVKSGHETHVEVGVLRVAVGKDTRVDLFEPGSPKAFRSCYGSEDLLLPPGKIEVAVSGVRDSVEVRAGEITPF